MDLLTVGIGFNAILEILKLTELYLRTIYLQELQEKNAYWLLDVIQASVTS